MSERTARLKALTDAEAAMALFHLSVTVPAAVDAALDFLDDMLLNAVRQAVLPRLGGAVPEPDPDRCAACDTSIGYVVVTFNQASHRPELDVVGLHDCLADAETERDELAAATARTGRAERHVICEIAPVEDEQ